MRTSEAGSGVVNWTKRILRYRRLPVVLALAAIVAMLPALEAGLFMDDLVQRAIELKPSQLPARLADTGFVSSDSGSLPVVLCDLFGFNRNPDRLALAKNYGVLAWWARDDLRGALWRPFTAFTHWLDYRLFPDSPALMHAHNIAWFAAILLLVTVVYRKLVGLKWVAGLAAVLFLLDKNSYFPVMFVANRGFVISLFFGLWCLYEHHQWRSTGSVLALILSVVSLALSLFANEAGASTLAFVLAYALVLEPTPMEAGLRKTPSSDGFPFAEPVEEETAMYLLLAPGKLNPRCALTVLPSLLVIVVWRLLYKALGFGVAHLGAYIDPGSEPFRFARQLAHRALALLGGQLTGLPPDPLLILSPFWQATAFALYCLFIAAALLAFLPLLRKDRNARFWCVAMLLALIPAATVTPIGKNLGFVAVAAFALIASFVGGLMSRQAWLPRSRPYKTVVWVIGACLILAHIPGAFVGRIMAAKTTPGVVKSFTRLAELGNSPKISEQDVVVINVPCHMAMVVAPFYRAYYGQPLPRTIRALVPGEATFEVKRTDDNTLVFTSQAPDIFASDALGPAHVAYAFTALNGLLAGERAWNRGDRQTLDGLTVEILEVSRARLPSRIAFRFDTSLDSPRFKWLRFDWRTFSYAPFAVPPIGESTLLPGPARRSESQRGY